MGKRPFPTHAYIRLVFLQVLLALPFYKAYVFPRRNGHLFPFSLLTTSHHATTSASSSSGARRSSLAEAFEAISSQFKDQSVDDIQRYLVQRGIDFARRSKDDQARSSSSSSMITASSSSPRTNTLLVSDYTKVPGCVANVSIRVIITDSRTIELQGTADALLSRGLLAILASVVDGQSVDAVLDELQAETVTDKLHLRSVLSTGRNDGVASMVHTLQRLVKSLLGEGAIEPEETTLSVEKQSKSTPEDDLQPSQKAPTVALLLSGGVDSSVALNLLKRQGYNITAFYLKIWLEDELAHLGQCPWEDDYRMCQQVCQQAGVPLEAISLQQEYKDRVISYTIHEAKQGRTPNPDIMCNSRVKFGCFYDAISTHGFDHVATGHYARLEKDDDTGKMKLFRAPDPVKDQSYFLCALTQEQLSRVLFPIGHLLKSEVRALAEEFYLPNRHRPDSQGLCFLGKVKFEDFLGAYLGEQPGEIVDAATGENLGTHRGLWYHTVGQRKGIGKVLKPIATARGPWYVVAKDPEQNVIYCSNQYDEETFAAARSQFTVEDIQWLSGSPLSQRLDMKIRHGPRIVSGFLRLSEDGSSGDVELDRKDSGLAPGQFVVFYSGEECLGGGVISERHWAKFIMQQKESAENNLTAVAT